MQNSVILSLKSSVFVFCILSIYFNEITEAIEHLSRQELSDTMKEPLKPETAETTEICEQLEIASGDF